MPKPAATLSEIDVRAIDGWTLHEFAEVTSTNLLAAHLPPWSAVSAAVQSAGRGRTGRAWVSDPGGLWLSAVVPTPGDPDPWQLLPLAAGWAVLSAVRELGVADARLRWPNDVLVGPRKLAGILVDRFVADAVVIGIGLNVTNRPEAADAALAGQVTRLAECVANPPAASALLVCLLTALTREHHRLEAGRADELCRDLNADWRHRHVHVTLAPSGSVPPISLGGINGRLEGVDRSGCLLVGDAAGDIHRIPAHRVELLREVD